MSTTLFTRVPQAAVPARIGLVLLSSDENGGDGFSSVVPTDAAQVVQTRIAFGYGSQGFFEVTSFGEMAATLPPEGRLDVLAFSCTSWVVETGVDEFLKKLERAEPVRILVCEA